MQGSVLSTGHTNCLVLGDDGVRYTFASQEWRGTSPPQVGTRVQFQLRGSVAVDVYPLLESSPQQYAVPPNVPPQQAAPPPPMPTAESSFGQQTAPSGPATTQPTGLPWLLIGSIAGVALVFIAAAFALGMFIASNSPDETEPSEAVSGTPAQVTTEVPIRTEPTKAAVATPSSAATSTPSSERTLGTTPQLTVEPEDRSTQTAARTVESVAIELAAEEAGELSHASGARIEVPEGSLLDDAKLSITEVDHPDTPVETGRVYDFSVGDALIFSPLTLHIPFELDDGVDASSIVPLHWDEDLEVWVALEGEPNADAMTVAVSVSELSRFTTTGGKATSAAGASDTGASPRIIDVDLPETVLAGESFVVHYHVQNEGPQDLGDVYEEAVGYVRLTYAGRQEEKLRLRARQGPFGWFKDWKAGVAYSSLTRSQYPHYRDDYFTPTLEEQGPATLRLELVFEDGGGEVIAVHSVERDVLATTNRALEPSTVLVEGREYRVSGEPNAQHGIDYEVLDTFDSSPVDGVLKDKAVFTAHTQQVTRSESGRRQLLAAQITVIRTVLHHYGADISTNLPTVLKVVKDIGILVMAPHLSFHAIESLAATVLIEVVKEVADHPENFTAQTARQAMENSLNRLRESIALMKGNREGRTMSYDDAVRLWDVAAYNNSHYGPANRALVRIAASRFGAALGASTAAAGAKQIDTLRTLPATEAVHLTEILVVLREVLKPLSEYEPWNTMQTELLENLAEERTKHANLLDSLGIENHEPLQLPVLAQINLDESREPTAVPEPAMPTPFQLYWDTSATVVEVGQSFDVSIRMHDPAFAGEHGGISVSFPLITESGGSNDRHISSIAEVEVVSYTSGTSNVTFHQPGATIYHRAGNRQFPADYLLVESDDPSWSQSDDRTLRLRITPKQTGEFPILVRGWLCVDGYTDCWRNPASGRSIDMQGWPAEQLLVHVVRAEQTAVLEPEWPMPFQIDWYASATDVEVGESIELSIRMHDSLFAGEHGGISVSFPSLFELSDSSDGYSSYVAEVQAVSYTSGLSKVAFHQPGATIYHRVGNQQFPADYLLVESDDPSWTTSDDRTLRLRITPKRAGEFPILIRGWLCADGYTDCSRNPESAGTVDQQGWDAIELTFSVASVESSKDAASALLKASFQNFRVIYVEFDDPDNPDLGCYSLLGNQFRRADWEDLEEFYASGGSIEELIAGLRWEDEKAGSSGGVRHPRVSREGAITWNGRHYFVSRHDHVPPGYFLVHDDINDRHLSLGSWYGEAGSEVLCYGTG